MRQTIDKVLEVTLVILMGLMVVNVVWQVFSRYVLNAPSSFTTELAGFLLIWVGILGSAYATGQKLHMAIDLLPSYTQGRKNVLLKKFIHFMVALFGLLVMVVGGGRLVFLSFQFQQLSSTLQVPIGYVYLVVPVSGLLMIYYSLYFLLTPDKNGNH